MPIRDNQIEHALTILMDRDHEAAKSRAAHEHMSDMDKVVKAKLMAECNEKSAAAKEAWALAHPTYQTHLEQKKAVAEMDYTWRDRRAAANAIIEMWRTEQSNARVAHKVT